MEIRGLDQFQQQLDRLQRNAEALDGEHEVSASEVFTPEFMRGQTAFESFDAMLEAVGITDKAGFEARSLEAWEQHVRTHSQFASWEEMKGAAAKEWAHRRLFDGL